MEDDPIRIRLSQLPSDRLADELIDLGNAEALVRDRLELLAAEHDAVALATTVRNRIGTGRRLVEVVCYRHLIRDILNDARSRAYGHAVKYYRKLAALDGPVEEYGLLGDHASFVAELRSRHGRKHGFWGRLESETKS